MPTSFQEAKPLPPTPPPKPLPPTPPPKPLPPTPPPKPPASTAATAATTGAAPPPAEGQPQVPPRPWESQLEAWKKAPMLSGFVKIRLLYQTPEIYKTDIADAIPMAGAKYACKIPPDTATGMGEPATPPFLHPLISFNKKVRRVHIHMVDTTTGDVYWDADYELPFQLMSILTGKYVLPGTTLARNPLDAMRTVCVQEDDPEPHLFDISISTQDLFYWDNSTPYGKREGFLNYGGPNAHIGFEAYRSPITRLVAVGNNKAGDQMLGSWTPGGSVSRGPTLADRHERVLAKQEDVFGSTPYDKSRLYYDYIFKPDARTGGAFKYLSDNAPPSLYATPEEFIIAEEKPPGTAGTGPAKA